MKDEKAIKRHYCGNGEGMFEDSKGAWVLYEDVKHLIELTNQHNQQSEVSELNSEKPSETVDTSKLEPAETLTEKTVEERALELYPVRMVEREIPKHVGQPFVYEEDDNEAARKAYIKGVTDNQNKQR